MIRSAPSATAATARQPWSAEKVELTANRLLLEIKGRYDRSTVADDFSEYAKDLSEDFDSNDTRLIGTVLGNELKKSSSGLRNWHVMTEKSFVYVTSDAHLNALAHRIG